MALPFKKPKFEPRDDPNYWNSQVVEGGGEGDGKPSGKLRPVDDEDLDEREEQAGEEELEGASSGDLASAEENAEDISETNTGNDNVDNSDSFSYSSESKRKRRVRLNWKKLAFGGGILGLVAGAVTMLYVFLPTLKVAHVLNNLEARFMGVAVNAIEARAEHLLSRYMRNYVLPSVSNCQGRVVSIDCNPDYDYGRGIASNLYRNWSNARIEQRLFTDHGILIEHRGGDNYRITTSSGNSVDIVRSTFELSDLDTQTSVGAREVRRELKNVLQNETFWKRLMLRHSVRKLASSKYNIRWCVFACDTRDSIRETSISAYQRLRLKIIERTVGPFSDRLGLYLTCAVTDCTNSQFDAQRSRIINQAIEELGEEEVQNIITEVSDRRLSQILVDRIVSKLFGGVAGRFTAATVPFVGWIYAIDAINQIDVKLYNGVVSQFLADNVASQYAEFYLTFKTNFDEGVDNQLSLDEVGAQSQLLDGLEGSLVFQRDLGSGAGTAFNPFTPANAQTAEYTCADSNPIPEGELVCEERKVGKQSGYDSWRQSEEAAIISGTLVGQYRCGLFNLGATITGNTCEPGSRPDVLWFFDGLIHGAFALFNSVLDAVSGAILSFVPSAFLDFFAGVFAQITQFLLEIVFPYLNPGTGPGRQVFDDLYAGVDVVGNEFTKGFEDPLTGELVGLGGRKLTDQEVDANLALYRQNELEQFGHKSLFARVFSTDDERSLISQMAMITPGNGGFSGVREAIAAWLNPKISLASIGSLFTDNTFAQATQFQGDPFGIHQYGYPVDDPVFTMDPEELTAEACSPGGEIYEAWVGGLQEQTVEGQRVQTTTNPCMLEYVATNILGCWFTESNDCGVGNASVVAPTQDGGVTGGTSPVAGLVSHPSLGPALPNGYFQVPAAPNSEYGFWPGTPLSQRCGSRALVDLVYTISVRWGQKYPGDRILVGDLNATGHLSHMNGVDWDIWTESSVSGSTFDTVDRARELGRMLADTGIVKNIFYNVTSVQNDFNAYVQTSNLSGVMSFEAGHYDHFHLRINDEFRGATSTSCADASATVLPGILRREVWA